MPDITVKEWTKLANQVIADAQKRGWRYELPKPKRKEAFTAYTIPLWFARVTHWNWLRFNLNCAWSRRIQRRHPIGAR